MLTNKVFVKKTKRGGILKVVREHYLRDDIWCGSEACDTCGHPTPVLDAKPKCKSSVCDFQHYLVPDTNILLHQIDLLEDPAFTNIIILQTVLEEVRHKHSPVYKRIKDLLANSSRNFYTFSNEHHRETYIERQPGESANDRNDRAIRVATQWYQNHLNKCKQKPRVQVVLLSDDRDNLDQAKLMKLNVFTISDYVLSLTAHPHLIDRLAQTKDTDKPLEGDKYVKFPEHLSQSQIISGLKTNRFLQGSFMASRENYLEALVSVEGHDAMILIQGRMNLNRAVHNDVVAIELLPESEWSGPSSVVLEDNDEEEHDLADDEKIMTEKSPAKAPKQPTAKIVGIIKRKWRQYCGMLLPPHSKKANRLLFVPAEKRIPRIRIETRQGESLMSQRIVVAIDSWPCHSRYPQGHFVKALGPVGDKETENEVLLLEHDIPHQDFSEAVLKCLPELPWIIRDEDLTCRRDLRNIVVCSVDPPGCTDIDDALHCRLLENGNYEVGVHIADVSHFIRPGIAIDKEAAERGTTVYLVDKRIDMVPELLSSNLCSLRSNEDRFAFSCIWEMTKSAEVLNVTYTKSIILSKASLTYAEAQIMIDDTSKTDDLAEGLRRLNNLAKILKKGRMDNGALLLASPEIRFTMDTETHDPIDVEAKELRETNSMVEEFMLLANVYVAKKIHEEFPECAVLRRHPEPPPSNFEPLYKAGKSQGFEINADTSKMLAASLDNAAVPGNPYFNTMLRILATRCMMQAVYFCSGTISESEFHHYGLAAPIYTHFTSPIRRYSDILVHRLLAVCIGADSTYPELVDKRKSQNICNNLNYRHKMAQYAARSSVNLNTHVFFQDRILCEDAYVLYVRKNALQILIPRFGLEASLFFKKRDASDVKFVYNEDEPSVTSGDVKIGLFDQVVVQLSIDKSNMQHQKLTLDLVQPQIKGFSIPAEDGPPLKKLKLSADSPLAKKNRK